MTHELLMMLQDIRLSAPDFVTDLMLSLSSPLLYLMIPIAAGAVLFWCVDKRSGEWVLMNMFCVLFVGHVLKDIIHSARPWLEDDRIIPEERALKGAEGYSTPSGHACESTAGFGTMALISRSRIILLALTVLVAAIMFSRLYLGVHTVFDLAVGFLTAIAVMAVNKVLLDISYSKKGAYNRIGVIYLLFFFVLTLVWYFNDSDTSQLLMYCAIALGAFSGRLIEHNLIGFEAKGIDLRTMVCRLIIGAVVTGASFLLPYMLLKGAIGMTVACFMLPIGIYVLSPSLFIRKSNN